MNSKRVIEVALILPVLAIGLLTAYGLVTFGETAERTSGEETSIPVSVVKANRGPHPLTVQATGVVTAAESVRVVPEVGGRIVKVAEELVPGGRLSKGDLLVTIDDRDYQAAVQEAEARVQQAALELQIEQGRGAVAEREWELVSDQDKTTASAELALRKPHLATAQRGLEAAEAGLQRANLALSRTRIRAPFNAVVVDESASLGQVVGPASPIANLVGTDTLWVTVSVPVSDLRALDIPTNSDEEGSKAIVSQRLSEGQPITREGRILRLVGQLDPQTRNAQLLVAIDGAMNKDDTGGIMLPGAYVDVSLIGRTIEDGFSIPRTALRENSRVWTVEDGRLALKGVNVKGGDQESVVFTGELLDGTQIITSSIALPIAGMLVAPRE